LFDRLFRRLARCALGFERPQGVFEVANAVVVLTPDGAENF
jgi:hypothetical protein